MRSIRTKLLLSFLALIVVLLSVNVFFIVEEFVFVHEYQNITNTMLDEYGLTQATTNLVNSFNTLIPSVNDQQLLAQYEGYRATIESLFATLDGAVTNPASKVAYIGLKNTINGVVAKLDTGIQAAQSGDITGESNDYDTALQQSYFVQQNAASLILDELQSTQSLQAEISRSEMLSELAGLLLLIVVSIGAVLYSILFSKRIVLPIERLGAVAKKVEGGNLDATVDAELLKGTDEVGSLANAFSTMLRALRDSIHQLDAEKKSVEQKVEQRTHELMEERAQLLASVNSLPFGFILLDSRRAVLVMNKVGQGLFEKKEGETLESIAKQLNIEAALETGYRTLIETGVTQAVGEVSFKERFLKVAITPVVLESEKHIIGSVILLEDITEAKRLEQSKSAFVAIASHEMRTPLTVIRGNAELLIDDPLVKANQGFAAQIDSILKSSVRLLSIVNDFLDLQNLEENKISLKIEPVDIIKALQETIADLTRLAAEKKLIIVFDPGSAPQVPVIELDKYRLQQIYMNLISNSIHYTEQGTITVTMQKEGDMLKIFFKDTGIGMGPEEQQHLFKRFQTGRAFLRSREYGSGMGLYISRFLARLMGGDVALFESAVGKGTTFFLTIPLAGKKVAFEAEGVRKTSVGNM